MTRGDAMTMVAFSRRLQDRSSGSALTPLTTYPRPPDQTIAAYHHTTVIMSLSEGVEAFERRSIEGETRGEWYLRQMLGSATDDDRPASPWRR